jgi:hypothetical protein
VGNGECAEHPVSFSVVAALWYPSLVEVRHPFMMNSVLQEQGPARPGTQDVLVLNLPTAGGLGELAGALFPLAHRRSPRVD